MENQHPPIVTKILNMTEKFLDKYGKVLIGLFWFPEPTGSFITFTDSLRTALMRAE